MHHKRKKPKSSRSGCLMCKPHKANGCGHVGKTDGLNMRNVRRMEAGSSEMKNIHLGTLLSRSDEV